MQPSWQGPPHAPSRAVQEIERCDEWALNITRMASSLGELADARANPLGASLQEGCICPCCNSSTCPTLAASRQVANTMQKQQAEEVRETAEMLKQAFQTVCVCLSPCLRWATLCCHVLPGRPWIMSTGPGNIPKAATLSNSLATWGGLGLCQLAMETFHRQQPC